jgi:hypothetical protein
MHVSKSNGFSRSNGGITYCHKFLFYNDVIFNFNAWYINNIALLWQFLTFLSWGIPVPILNLLDVWSRKRDIRSSWKKDAIRVPVHSWTNKDKTRTKSWLSPTQRTVWIPPNYTALWIFLVRNKRALNLLGREFRQIQYSFIVQSRGLLSCDAFYPEDGGSMDLWIVGILPQLCTVSQPRRAPHETSRPWKPQNSQCSVTVVHYFLGYLPVQIRLNRIYSIESYD